MPLAQMTTDTDEEELRASHMESEYNDIRQAFFEAFEKQCFGAAPPPSPTPFLAAPAPTLAIVTKKIQQ